MSERDPSFYVGYLPAPAGLKRFVIALSVVLIVVVAGLGVVGAALQRDPGSGTWQTGTQTELTGWIIDSPYPAIQVVSGPEDYVGRTVVMMSQGKLGADDRIAFVAGNLATVRGAIISRGGLSLLELAGGFSAIEEADWTEIPSYAVRGTAVPPVRPASLPEDLGARTLSGEIIDSKCALGVMRPGTGKAHKACATLCILGGVPPMFLVRGPEGTFDAYVLTGPDGEAVDRHAILELVADPVSVSGRLERRDGLVLFKIEPDAVERL